MAIRTLHLSKYNAHTESLFKKSKILPLHLLTEYFKLQFVHRAVHNFLPASLENMFITNAQKRLIDNSDRGDLQQLRNQEDLYVPLARLASTEKQPLVYFPKIWNDLNDTVLKNTVNKAHFNSLLKRILLDRLEDDFKCNRLLCPHCHLPPT
jgi:hypothetical protein